MAGQLYPGFGQAAAAASAAILSRERAVAPSVTPPQTLLGSTPPYRTQSASVVHVPLPAARAVR